MKGSNHAQASFLYSYTLEYNYFFHIFFKSHMSNFPQIRYTSSMETNITTIYKKILAKGGDPMRVDDMLKASVYVDSE